MSTTHKELMDDLLQAVLGGEAVTERTLRTAVKNAAAASGDLGFKDGSIPAELWPYLQKVSRNAYKVTDGNVETLKAMGYSEDAIFELTVSAAVGAGLGRLERGLALLGKSRLNQREVGDEVR